MQRRDLLKLSGAVLFAGTTIAESAPAKIRYRPQRGLLADSMALQVEVKDFYDLVEHLRSECAWIWATSENVTIRPYDAKKDERIEWLTTHLVQVDGHIFGFTNSPVPLPREVALRRNRHRS